MKGVGASYATVQQIDMCSTSFQQQQPRLKKVGVGYR
jgi:hypothetical protein